MAKPAESVWYLVQDAVDAYWQVLLHPQERKYYCAMLRRPGKKPTFLAYNRTAQGSRGAPLSWTILYGLICHLACSTLRCPVTPDSQRMEVYVDDPVCLLLGTEPECKQQAAIMTLAWAALGIVLAFAKGQFGRTVNWIGASFESTNTGVVATILRARLDDLLALVRDLLSANVASIKKVRTLTGKAQSIASLLWVWRPFVHMLYAAIYAPIDPYSVHRPPAGCIWTKQIHVPLRWLVAFLTGRRGNLHRTLSLESYMRLGKSIVLTTDASPYGLGAVLTIDGTIAAWFSN